MVLNYYLILILPCDIIIVIGNCDCEHNHLFPGFTQDLCIRYLVGRFNGRSKELLLGTPEIFLGSGPLFLFCGPGSRMNLDHDEPGPRCVSPED